MNLNISYRKTGIFVRQVIKQYTYRIFPTEEQQVQLCNIFGCSRYIYNKILEQRIKEYTTGKKLSTCIESMLLIKTIKEKNKWLETCPSQVLQMTLRNLDNDCTRFNKGSKYPIFRKKINSQSIQFPQGVKVKFKKNTIQIPKLRDIPCVYDRKFTGCIKIVTLYRTTTDKYYVHITVEQQKKNTIKKPVSEDTTIGISTGINTWYALSNGTRISKPVRIVKAERNVKIQQRALGRKIQGSERQVKQIQSLLRAKERLSSMKRDYLQKVTTKIIIEYHTIVVENVQDNQLIDLIRYKSQWYNNNLIEIGKCVPCSDICSSCGTVNKVEEVSWICTECEMLHNRNRNTAENIKKLGLRSQPSIANV